MTTRRLVPIAACLAAAGLCVAAASTSGAPPRVSVLLLTLDTTRADRLGCYGAGFAATPNLDALARGGVRFDQALSPAPLTLPAHASLFTARVPRRHGVRDNALFRLGADPPVLAETFRRAGYRTAAFVSAAVLDRGVGLARGFDLYDDRVRVGDRSAFNYEERAASQTVDAALAALPALEPPFLLWVHLFDPHLPYVPPEPYRTRFKETPYDGEIAFMDREIGRLLEAVRRRAPWLVVLAIGDHGESLGEHGEEAHGIFVYQATQRVPFLLCGTGVPSGVVVRRPVGLIDAGPTLLDLLGLAPLPDADGRPLAPLFRRDGGPTPGYEMESFFGRFAYGWSPVRAWARGGLKYVDAPRPELYDLARDPGEKDDAISRLSAKARPLADELRRRVAGDSPSPEPLDAELAEQRKRLAALGYAAGASPADDDGSAIDPKDGVIWLKDLDAARRDLQLGNPADGVPKLERLLARNPRNVNATLTLVQCLLASGNADRAATAARRAVDLGPENDLAWFNLANALAEKSRQDARGADEARSAYERALSIDPRTADVYLAYAAFAARREGTEGARRVLERGRSAGVSDPDLETELGLLELARGAASEARAALERAIVLNPRQTAALTALGKLAFDAGRFRDSAAYYGRALDASPSAAMAKTLGAIYLHKLDDREGARRAFRRALALMRPGDPDATTVREILEEIDER